MSECQCLFCLCVSLSLISSIFFFLPLVLFNYILQKTQQTTEKEALEESEKKWKKKITKMYAKHPLIREDLSSLSSGFIRSFMHTLPLSTRILISLDIFHILILWLRFFFGIYQFSMYFYFGFCLIFFSISIFDVNIILST